MNRRTSSVPCASAASRRSDFRSSISRRPNSGGRFVFVLLRGGFDGLAAVVPYGDPSYRSLRSAFAFEESELVELTDTFGLAPGLAPLRELWQKDELVALHAMAIPYRTRSHFDGQAILETGIDKPVGSSDGWLNRLLQVMPGQRSGIAIASGMPRSLTGSHDVQTWSPTQLGAVNDAYLDRLSTLYRTDKVLYGRFEAAMQQQDLVGEEPMAGGGARRGGITPLMQAAAKILRQDGGPEHRGRRVQRMGYAREPGACGRRARQAARPARGRADGVPHRHGRGVGQHDGGRDDRVRTNGAAERHARHRSRNSRRGLHHRPARWRSRRCMPTGPGWAIARCSKGAI